MNTEIIEMSGTPFSVSASEACQVRYTDGQGVVRLVIFVGPGAKADAQGHANYIKGVVTEK